MSFLRIFFILFLTSVALGADDGKSKVCDVIFTYHRGNGLHVSVADIVCPACQDVVFIVDASASVGSYRFDYRFKPFMKSFATSRLWNVSNTDPTHGYQVCLR